MYSYPNWSFVTNNCIAFVRVTVDHKIIRHLEGISIFIKTIGLFQSYIIDKLDLILLLYKFVQ